MHIAASSPLAIDKDGINQKIVDKELRNYKSRNKNSGKPTDLQIKFLKVKFQNF